MPVVAAVGVIGGATALATGALTVMQTIAAIGSIVGGIGALTGNKTLAKIGAVAGLAGGIGAFAEGQGWLASGDAMQTAADAASGATPTAIEVMKNTPSGAEASAASTGLAGAATEPVSNIVGNQAQQLTGGIEGSLGMPGEAGNSIAQTVGQQSSEALKAMGSGTVDTSANAGGLMDASLQQPLPDVAPNPTDIRLGQGTQATPMATSADQLAATIQTGGTRIFDAIKSVFEGKDGKLDKTLLALSANFVGGVFDDKKKAEAELYKTRAETERQQMANASAVPSMNLGLNRDKPVFRPTSPTYHGVRTTSGLFNAR